MIAFFDFSCTINFQKKSNLISENVSKNHQLLAHVYYHSQAFTESVVLRFYVVAR